MSYIDGFAWDAKTQVYNGADDGTPVIMNNFMFRIDTTLNRAQVKTLAGTETVEIYNTNSFSGGSLRNVNYNNLALNSTTWSNIDPNNILQDGSELQLTWLTPTAPGDNRLIQVRFWHPTPTKTTIVAREIDPTTGTPLDNSASSIVVHHHRLLVPDFPVISTFNSQTYPANQGWVPSITGDFMTVTAGTFGGGVGSGHGLNFRINAGGNWELYGDMVGGTESWKTDLIFTRYPIAAVTRFGTFN